MPYSQAAFQSYDLKDTMQGYHMRKVMILTPIECRGDSAHPSPLMIDLIRILYSPEKEFKPLHPHSPTICKYLILLQAVSQSKVLTSLMYMRPTRDLRIKCMLQDGSIDCMGKTIYPHDQTLVNLSQMLQRMQETF